MIRIEIVKETHVVLFDKEQSIVTQFVFKLGQQQVKQTDANERQEDQEQKTASLEFIVFVENLKQIKTESEYFDIQEEKTDVEYGDTPFSLQTFLEMYKDPRLHTFTFKLKTSVNQSMMQLTQKEGIGRMVIKSSFRENPFRFPVRADTQVQKHIHIITKKPGPDTISEEFVICSGKLVENYEIEEYPSFKWEPNEDKSHGLMLYQYEVSKTVQHKNICIFKDLFEHRRHRIYDVDLLILSVKPSPVENIPNLKDAITRLMANLPLRSTIIIQNCPTTIQECDGVVFHTRSCNLFQRLFRSHLYSKIKDEWLLYGMVGFKNNNRDFHVKLNEMCEFVSKGEEFLPIYEAEYSTDDVWKLKATLVYYIMANLTRQGDKITNMLLQSIKQGKRMTTESFKKTIKNKYGLVNLQRYVNQFIKGTGISRLYYEFGHVKKQNRIIVQIRQKPLQSAVFQFYNSSRAKLQSSYDCRSILTERMLEKNKRADQLHQPSTTLKKKQMLLGPLLVPLRLQSNSFVYGRLPVVIAETNELEYREEEYEFQLKKRKISKKGITCRGKLRKTINKKGIAEKEGSRLPSWMKVDPLHTFLFQGKNQSMDQNKLQRQITREKNQMEMLKVIQHIKQYPTDTMLVNEICNMLDIKEGNNTSLEIREEILSIFPVILTNSQDRKPWDLIQTLLRLYEPPCYDRSIDGHKFKLAMLDCLAKLKIRKGYSTYFEEFHRILLAMSRDSDNTFWLGEEIEFRRSLYRAMLNWRTKFTIDVLIEVHDICEVYAGNVNDYRQVIRLIMQRVHSYLEHVNLTEENCQVVGKLKNLFNKLTLMDKSHKLWLCNWITALHKAEKEMPILDFFTYSIKELESIRMSKHCIYEEALKAFKDILSKNKKKYALDMQLNALSLNQNYVLAEMLWQNLTTGESLTNPTVRLYWIKIYRTLYFYFTPVCVPAKLVQMRQAKKQNVEGFRPYEFQMDEFQIIQALDGLKDFNPDLDWLVGYDIYHKKSDTLRAQDKEENERGRHKKRLPNVDINIESNNAMARFVKNHREKEINWVELSKHFLELIIQKHENKRTKPEIINQLKAVKKKLKRGNMPKGYSYELLKEEALKVLDEGEQETETIKELYNQTDNILDMVVRQEDTKVILPAKIIKKDSSMVVSMSLENSI